MQRMLLFGCTVVPLSGMIRFVKIAIFSGVQQLLFIRKATVSGRFNCQNTHDSFRWFALYICEPWGLAA